VNEFMSNETTKKFIESCFKKREFPFFNIEKEEDLYVSRQKSGTFMQLTCRPVIANPQGEAIQCTRKKNFWKTVFLPAGKTCICSIFYNQLNIRKL
jgi:hypothetical protein